MRKKIHLFTSVLLMTALLLTGFTSTIAMAKPFEKIRFSGTVSEVTEDGPLPFTFLNEEGLKVIVSSPEDGILIIEVFDGYVLLDNYTISIPESFEFGSTHEGDACEIEIRLNEETGEWELYKYKLKEQKREQERENGGHFCSDGAEGQHPVALSIAETYDTNYETVISLFCSGEGDERSARTGFGNIMLAFHTSEVTVWSVEDILEKRLGGKGWGQIWQEMGLIGKPDNTGPPDGKGKPDHAGKSDHADPKK